MRSWRSGKPVLRWLSRPESADETFWALRGVDFAVQPGEVLGVICRNGAGKSTLLKILSRITPPTGGRVDLHGRVGSLLEVGTGFHPELTGRENIYLSGAILGMRRHEIRDKFDRIVEFAEIGPFLDTPVKRYSSGMYVRLAFAVAAHLNPEVLLVDEVLAVGDATYQRRCIQRMAALAESGMTVLFVSHNMDLIPRLCGKAVLLQAGRVAGTLVNVGNVERYTRLGVRLVMTSFFPWIQAGAKERDYTWKEMAEALATTQQGILQVLDYLYEVGANTDIDTLRFTNLLASDVTLSRSLVDVNDLLVRINATGEVITVDQHFVDSAHGLERLQFAERQLSTILQKAHAHV